jgi:hypothetical protein
MWGFLGLIPGLGMLYFFEPLRERHLMTVLQTVAYLFATFVVVTFGLFLGAIVGLLALIAEKFCLPEE